MSTQNQYRDQHPDQRVADAVNHIEIRRVLDGYADAVSRRDWQALNGLFLPGAQLELDLRQGVRTLTGPTDIGEFIAAAVQRFEFFQFIILGVTIQLRPGDIEADHSDHGDHSDHATARTYMSELRQDAEGHQWSQIYGVYHDRFEHTSDGWMLAHRAYHSMARRFEGETSTEVFPFPDQFQRHTHPMLDGDQP